MVMMIMHTTCLITSYNRPKLGWFVPLSVFANCDMSPLHVQAAVCPIEGDITRQTFHILVLCMKSSCLHDAFMCVGGQPAPQKS